MVGRFGKEELEAVESVIRSGRLSSFYRNPDGGEMVRRFEEEFAEYLGVEYAVSFNSGTSALFASIKALGLGEGDVVLVPALTFVSTATAPLMAGCRVRFVDVDDTLCMDPASVEERVDGASAVMPVHLLGCPADMDEIKRVASEEGLPVIEDACQALGGRYKFRKLGTMGDVGVFSFQETKTITTLGEGGMAVTNEEWLANRLRMIRNHGEKYYRSLIMGYNFRMTEAQAAFGLAQLRRLDYFNQLQRSNAEDFREMLPSKLRPVRVRDYCVYHIIATYVEDDRLLGRRGLVVRELEEKGVSKGVPGDNVSLGYTAPLYDDVPLLGAFKEPCPRAEWYTQRMLWFDIHRWKTYKEFKEVMSKVLEVLWREFA